MNLAPDTPILRFIYWLVNSPGLGGMAVSAIVLTCLASFAAALRWIVAGGRVADPVTYAYPTPALHHAEATAEHEVSGHNR